MNRKNCFALIIVSCAVLTACISQPLYSQFRVVINDETITDESEWISGVSTVKIVSATDYTGITFKVFPDSGLIDVPKSMFFPVQVFVDDKMWEDLPVELKNEINEYRFSVGVDEKTGEDCAFIKAKLGASIDLGAEDWLILPFVGKVLRFSFRKAVPKKSSVRIFRKASD